MWFRPLSTYTVLPVMAEARGDTRNAAAAPTSEALSSFCMGAFSCEYLWDHDTAQFSQLYRGTAYRQ